MPDARFINELFRSRRDHYQMLHAGMEDVRTVYEGELTIDLPEMDKFTKPPVPNLLAQGVDQMAGRVASVIPTVSVVPETTSRANMRRAATAAKVYTGWWAADRVPLKLGERARHLIAYGLTTTSLTWDRKQHRPTWRTRSPLGTYPDPNLRLDQPIPDNIIWTYQRTLQWLKNNGYGNAVMALADDPHNPRWDQNVILIDYADNIERHLVGMSPASFGYNEDRAVTLERYEHGYGMTPATVTPRIGLEGLSGQFDQMISMYEAQARLMALEIIAVEKGIFPDTYLVSRPGEIGRFVDGPHDGRTGKVNVVAGGDIRTEQPQPGYLTNPTIDRLERNARVDASLPPEFGGESGGNVRTGRRGDAVLSAAIDMPIAYAQQLLATALEAENQIAATMALRHDKENTRTIHVGLGSSTKPVTYKPRVTFGNDKSTVTYPAAGSDINALVVGLGQRVGLGTMSKRTAAVLDPWVDDPELEHDRVTGEGLEQALMAGIQQQAQAGALPPMTVARIIELVESDKMELPQALNKATEEAMAAQQAQQQQQGPPNAAQMAAGPTAAALTGNPEAMSPIQGVGEGMSDLTGMLASLRMPMAGMDPRLGETSQGAVAV